MKGMRQIKTHFICLARQIVHKHPSNVSYQIELTHLKALSEI
jgi:hypothetical protein